MSQSERKRELARQRRRKEARQKDLKREAIQAAAAVRAQASKAAEQA